MTHRLVIAGAGGFGREVACWVETSPRLREQLQIGSIVFIDDASPAVTPDHPIVSSIEGYLPEATDLVVCAIGSPAVRRSVVTSLAGRGARFATIIHDSVTLGAHTTIGEGSVLCPNVLVSVNVAIGKHVHINTFSAIGHDARVGDYVTMSAACQVTGGVSLHEQVFLGTSAILHPRITVERQAVVGAGSVAIRRVRAHTTVFGVPATVIVRRRPGGTN